MPKMDIQTMLPESFLLYDPAKQGLLIHNHPFRMLMGHRSLCVHQRSFWSQTGSYMCVISP